MTPNLIIIRTYQADAASLQAYDLYATLDGFETVFCVDERKAAADMGGRDKVGFDDAGLTALGLYPHPDCGWQCGDYAYHVTRAARPDHDFYWLVEPDVRINTDDLPGFFALFAHNRADLLAPRLTFNDTTWSWNKEIAATGLPPWRCFFPITRLSGRAIDHVHEVRRSQGRNPAIAGRKTWPNDEGLTASALKAGGFDCADLNQGAIVCHTGASLNGVALIDPGVLAEMPPDGLIYHPVRDFAPWFAGAVENAARIDREHEEDPAPGRIAGRARTLTRIAQTCLRHPDYADASLVPSLQGQALWTHRPDGASLTAFMRDFDERAAKLCTARLEGTFGVTHHRRLTGTAHTARCRTDLPPDSPVHPADFPPLSTFDLGRFPRNAAIPYAWDFDAGELLFTVHLGAAAILDSPDLVAAQRHATRIVVRAPQSRLARIYGPQNPSEAPLLIAFARAAEDAARCAACLRDAGLPTASLPGPLVQLAELLPRIGQTLAAPAFERMVRLSIDPLRFVTHPAGRTALRCVVLAATHPRLAVTIARQFPQARLAVLSAAEQKLLPALQRAERTAMVVEASHIGTIL